MTEMMKGVSNAMRKLARLRWKGVSKEKRSEWSRAMNKKRWEKK